MEETNHAVHTNSGRRECPSLHLKKHITTQQDENKMNNKPSYVSLSKVTHEREINTELYKTNKELQSRLPGAACMWYACRHLGSAAAS